MISAPNDIDHWNITMLMNNMTLLNALNKPKACLSSPVIPGGRLNKKDGLTRYGDSHVKDKTS